MASNVVASHLNLSFLTKHGLKTTLTEDMKRTLHEKDIYYDEPSNPLEPISIPIGMCFEEGFVFKNKYKIPSHDKYRITKPMHKTYQLNKNQKIVMSHISSVVRDLQQKRYPIYLCIQAECGFGKTLLAINIIFRMKFNKTFVIVHSKTAAAQFGAKVNKFLPGLDVHVSEKGPSLFLDEMTKEESQVPDVLIVPVQHLLHDDFVVFLQKNYSLGFVDEAHINNFHQESGLRNFFMNHVFPTVISMTATPRVVNKIYLGQLIACHHLVDIKHDFQKHAIAIISDQRLKNYHCSNDYQTLKKAKTPTTKHVAKLRALSRDDNRRKMIKAKIKLEYMRRLNARIILLCEYVEEVIYYSNAFRACGYQVISKSGEDEVVNSVNEFVKDKKRYIVIGTVSKLGTGFDLPSCNTVFLTLMYNTLTDIQQYAGRCTRNYKPDNCVDRKFYYFVISPIEEITLNGMYKNMKLALKQSGWNLKEMYCAPKTSV